MRRPWLLVLLVALLPLLGAPPLAAQSPDVACLRVARGATDSVAKLHLSSTVLTQYQVRNLRRLDSLHTARCVGSVSVPPPDTVVPPPPVDTVAPPPPPIDTTPPSPVGGFVGPAELPRSVPQFPASLATASCTQTIPATGLQAAVGAARAGDVLCLTPGDRFRGTLTLPHRADSGWVVVRTAPTPGQPAPGQRVRPSQVATLASLATTAGGNAAALRAAPGARGWYLTLLEVTLEPTVATIVTSIVDLPRGARDLVFDRLLIRAGPTQAVQRCVTLNSAATTMVASWLDECHAKGYDSQAIVTWESDGPVLVTNTTLAGAGENVMLGGADPSVAGVVPQDWTITHNHVVTPLAWKGTWTKKNLLETKNARRILVEGNVFEGSWPDGQDGLAVILKSANQYGACRWCGTSDFVFRRNLIVRVAGILNVNGQGGDRKAVDSLTRRIAVVENYADSLGGPYGLSGAKLLPFYTQASDVLVRHNTWLSPPGQGSSYSAGSATEGGAATRLTVDGDVRTRGQYLFNGCWTGSCAPGLSLRLVLIGAPTTTLPGVTFAPTLDAALALGFGVSRATIDAATRGVVVQP